MAVDIKRQTSEFVSDLPCRVDGQLLPASLALQIFVDSLQPGAHPALHPLLFIVGDGEAIDKLGQ